jgi:hypothetical protein
MAAGAERRRAGRDRCRVGWAHSRHREPGHKPDPIERIAGGERARTGRFRRPFRNPCRTRRSDDVAGRRSRWVHRHPTTGTHRNATSHEDPDTATVALATADANSGTSRHAGADTDPVTDPDPDPDPNADPDPNPGARPNSGSDADPSDDPDAYPRTDPDP